MGPPQGKRAPRVRSILLQTLHVYELSQIGSGVMAPMTSQRVTPVKLRVGAVGLFISSHPRTCTPLASQATRTNHTLGPQ